MSSFAILIAMAATGIDVGWEPLAEGGYQYTIQIEPELAETFLRGEHEIVSAVPPQIDVRRYRIVVGSGKLARVDSGRTAAVKAPPQPVAKTQAPPPRRPPVSTYVPPAEVAAQPPAEPPPTANNQSLKDLPEPPDGVDEGPAMATPTDPQVAANAEPPSGYRFQEEPPPVVAHEPAGKTPRGIAETPPNLLQSNYEEPAQVTQTNRLDSGAKADAAEPARPWTAFVLALVLLCCSLGANAYLGWIAWEARSRYRQALAKLGPAGAA